MARSAAARKEMEQEDIGASVDAIQFLENQHREVEDLFAQIEKMGNRASKARDQLLQELASKIEIHSKLEEKIFYPLGREIDETMTLESYEEHGVVRMVLKKIMATDPSDESFMAKITVLKELIQHHVKEEETEFFPKLQEELSEERLSDVGMELQEEFENLQEKEKAGQKKAKKKTTKAKRNLRKVK